MIMNITYLVIMKTCHHPSMSGKKYEGAETAWTLLTRLNLECCWRLTENFHFTFWYFVEWISKQSSLSAEVVNATFSYFVGWRILYIWVLFCILMCLILVPNKPWIVFVTQLINIVNYLILHICLYHQWQNC